MVQMEEKEEKKEKGKRRGKWQKVKATSPTKTSGRTKKERKK